MNIEFLKQNILFLWFEWHFFDVPREILKAWKNFLKFNLNYFSVPTLVKTFFYYWRRYKINYGRSFNPGRYFQVFVFNSFSRFVGAVLRFFLIILSLFFEVLIFFLGLVLFLVWFALPVLIALGFIIGVRLLF